MTHPVKHVSDLPGLLLQAILPVHGVDDHQLTCTFGQSCSVENIKNSHVTLTTAYHVLVEHIQTQVIHPIVSVLPGLLLQVVLAVHGVVDHQTTLAKIRQVGYQIKGLSMNFIVLQFSCMWVR